MSAKARKPKYLLLRQGRYWARVTVPKELRPIVGRNELREPLGPDLKAAERRLHSSVARMLATLDRARRELRPSSPATPFASAARRYDQTPEELAREFYRFEVDLDEQQRNFTFDSGEALLSDAEPILFRSGHKAVLQRVASGRASLPETREVIGWAVEHFRAQGKTSVEPGSEEWTALCRLLAAAQLEAVKRAEERDISGVAGEPEHPLFKPGGAGADSRIGLAEVVAGYFAELQTAGKGKKAQLRWRPVFTRLEEFLGHDKVQRITRKDLLRWKDELLQRFSPKTVKDTYLAAVGAVFQWAVDNGRMAENPAAGIKVRASAVKRERERGFTELEAQAVLRAAMNYTPARYAGKHTREFAGTTAAKRWTPFLAAYTGARISELTQLRKTDVREEQGIKYLRLTPAAGSIKSGWYRDVPIHPHLVELGFLEFVEGCGDGPLFYHERESTAQTSPAEMVSSRVCKWVRSLGVIGDVQPNHGWRHRLKTQGTELGISARILDAIQGHAARTAGEQYGDITLKAKDAAIRQFPRLPVADSEKKVDAVGLKMGVSVTI